MRLNWNEGINRLILLIAVPVGWSLAIIDKHFNKYSYSELESGALFLFYPLVVAGCLLLLKVAARWIWSGFTKPPKKGSP